MGPEDKLAGFEESILPHMDAAYNLARWLARSDVDAQDIVQESYLRAYKFFAGYRGGDSRSWLLRIVRNTFYTWLEQTRRDGKTTAEADELSENFESPILAPDEILLRQADNELLREAIEELPVEFRETLVMRDLEGLSYKEIAEVADIPLGTVMSRLARARRLLREKVVDRLGKKG